MKYQLTKNRPKGNKIPNDHKLYQKSIQYQMTTTSTKKQWNTNWPKIDLKAIKYQMTTNSTKSQYNIKWPQHLPNKQWNTNWPQNLPKGNEIPNDHKLYKYSHRVDRVHISKLGWVECKYSFGNPGQLQWKMEPEVPCLAIVIAAVPSRGLVSTSFNFFQKSCQSCKYHSTWKPICRHPRKNIFFTFFEGKVSKKIFCCKKIFPVTTKCAKRLKVSS
jgi:hypothetical protein